MLYQTTDVRPGVLSPGVTVRHNTTAEDRGRGWVHKMKETEQREARSSMRRGMLRDVAFGCDNQRGLIWQAPISFLVWQLISGHV